MIKVLVQLRGDCNLILPAHFLGVVVEMDALSELEGEEQRMSDLVSDVWRREVVYQAYYVWCYLLLQHVVIAICLLHLS